MYLASVFNIFHFLKRFQVKFYWFRKLNVNSKQLHVDRNYLLVIGIYQEKQKGTDLSEIILS